MKTECVADISMNSVLAEYSRALYEQYGLLMVDTSYGTGNHSILNTQEHLRNYVQKNFDRSKLGAIRNAQTMTAMYCKEANITGYSFASDNGGAVLNRQILAYMGAEPVEGLLTDVENNLKSLQEGELDTTDVEAMARANQEELNSIELPTFINDKGEEEEQSLGNPADAVNATKGFGALSLSVKNTDNISKATTNTSALISHRERNKGTGLDDTEDISLSERALIEQYYYEKCSRYGAEMDKAVLKYQLEYLIYGESSDYANLEKMAECLLFWREASNMLYLFSNSQKMNELDVIASAIALLVRCPDIKDPLKYSMAFAWTFAESIKDLNILFSGGRVPLFKSDETWQLTWTKVLSFRDFLNGGDCGSGLYYEDYLRIRLLMTSSDVKTVRMMDVIEMDVRNTDGNSNFKMDYCLDIFRAEIVVGTKYGYEAKIERIYGYEL
ncbi:DUF5702 domain-containing protein [Butyrivibrio proteoclasticus]|uniref:DUF5702 domain-containing protein n=1 Tax=Butyrivibrio proteoclasticus TaxID=43305 RepID=UPI000478E84F|nr:DUF5702 domain-containing protein [Butyrivibrio proteoclasticus]